MAFALVGTAGVLSTGAASAAVTPAWGTGETRTAGNLLICCVAGFGSATMPVTPAGWSVAAQKAQGIIANATVFYKVATGGDAAPTIAAVASQIWEASLAEFSGGYAVAPLDQAASAAATTGNPVVATAAATDTTAGELIVMASSAKYSAAATKTLTHTLNNGATAISLANNSATSTASHCYHAYGITTGQAAADSDSLAITTTNRTGAALALASFKLTAAPISGLIDTFPGSSLDIAKWSAPNGGVTVAGNQASLSILLSYATFFQSAMPLRLTGSVFFTQITIPSLGSGSRQSMVDFTLASGDKVGWLSTGTWLKPAYILGGIETDISAAQVAVTPGQQSFVRISESAGTVGWDTSADGVTWTNAYSRANPIATLDYGRLRISAGYWGTEAAANFVVGNVNTLAVAPALTWMAVV